MALTRTSTSLLALITIAPALAFTQGAAAQGSDTSMIFGEEILVTAQRREQRLQEVPVSVVALSGTDLANSRIESVRDLQLLVPGLNYTAQGPFAEPNIRGIHTTITQASSESPVAIYLDGFYQPNQAGNIFDLPDVRQVEVLKGPQGTLFGRNASGGAILIRTEEPSYETTGRVSVSDGLFIGQDSKTSNEITVKGFVSVPLVDQKLAMSVSGYYNYLNGYLVNDVDGSRSGRVESYMARAKVLFEPTESVRFLLSGMFAEREDNAANATAAVGGATVAGQYPDAISPVQPWHVASELRDAGYVDTKRRSVNLRSEFDIGEAGTLTSLTGYNYVRSKVVSEVDGAYAPSCLEVVACISPFVVNYGPSKTWQQELTFASEDFGAVSFVAGVFLYSDKSDLGTRVNPDVIDGIVDYDSLGVYYSEATVKTEAYAGFSEVTVDVTDQLSVTGGLRYSWEKKVGNGNVFGGADYEFGNMKSTTWTPRLSLMYRVNDALNLYATYSQGFKSGVIDSVGLIPNNEAQPEKLRSYEVGFKVADAGYNLNAAFFYYDYTNLQDQVLIDTVTLLANAASAEIYGMDVDGAVHLSDSLTLRAAASWIPHAKFGDYTDAVVFLPPFGPFGMAQAQFDATGTRLLKTPKFTGSLSLHHTAEVAGGTLDSSANVYYSDSFRWELSGRVNTKKYATLGLQVGYTPAGSDMRIGVYGRNLTNNAHIITTTLSNQADTFVYAPPRQIGVSFDYNF